MMHLPPDQLGTILDGYRQLGPLDFDNDSVRWAAVIWANVAIEFIECFTGAECESNERLAILRDGIADILVRLNEYPPLTLPEQLAATEPPDSRAPGHAPPSRPVDSICGRIPNR